jgi:serine/threonine-protein kinase
VLPGAQPAKEGTRIGRNPRLRVVEDFSRPEPRPEEGDPEDRIDTAKLEPEETVSRSRVSEGTVTRARLPPSLVRGHPSEQPPAEPDRSYIPMPPPTSPEVKAAVAQQRLFTEERNLLEDARRRRQMLALSGVIALVATVCFAIGVWKFTQRPQLETDPKVSAVSGAVEQYLQQQPPEPPEPPKPRNTSPPEPVVVSASGADDSPKSGIAYLSLSANLPARAYIDGIRVKRNLPLVRYPVRSGTREIIVETIGTPRQREVFQVRVERGEHKKLEQLFKDNHR